LSLGARRLDDAFHQPPGNALSAQGARRLDMENQDAVIGTAVIRKRDLPARSNSKRPSSALSEKRPFMASSRLTEGRTRGGLSPFRAPSC
jgi:hypothetical protein